MKKFLPIIGWLPKYKKSFLLGDLSAGFTLGILLIPQGLAYASIAGLPPIYGLYAGLIPQVVYSIFGTSRHLSVGPVAMDSLLVAIGVASFASSGSESYISLAILLAFTVGIIQLLSGVFKLGFLVNFLSKPIISGFTFASAVIIGVNQLKHIVGLDIKSGSNVFLILSDLFLKFNEWNLSAIAISLMSILVIKISGKLNKKIPSALIVVILGILAVYFFDLPVLIIGFIPEGLPSFAVPNFDKTLELMPVAFTIALIGYTEAISISKSLENEYKKGGALKVENNQEMIAIGLSNLIGSFFGSYSVTGSFSRSAVNAKAGVNTGLASLFSAVLIALVLIFFTSLFYYLPKAVLGSIILVAVLGLINFKWAMTLWRHSRQDFIMFLATFIITITVGIKEGVFTGVILSLFALVYRTSRPHIAVLGRLQGSEEYRNVARFNDLEVREDVVVLRQDAQLFFANASHFSDFLKEEVYVKRSGVKLVILHFGSVSSVDTTALQMLRDVVEDLNKHGVGVYFSDVIGPVRDFFEKTGFTQEVGVYHFFTDVDSAIKYLDSSSKLKSKQMLKQALQHHSRYL